MLTKTADEAAIIASFNRCYCCFRMLCYFGLLLLLLLDAVLQEKKGGRRLQGEDREDGGA